MMEAAKDISQEVVRPEPIWNLPAPLVSRRRSRIKKGADRSADKRVPERSVSVQKSARNGSKGSVLS